MFSLTWIKLVLQTGVYASLTNIFTCCNHRSTNLTYVLPTWKRNLTVCLFIIYLLEAAQTSVCLSTREISCSQFAVFKYCKVRCHKENERRIIWTFNRRSSKREKFLSAFSSLEWRNFQLTSVFSFLIKREFHFHFGKHKHMILNWMWVRVDGVYIRHFTHVFDLQFSHRRVYFIFICLFFLMNAIISTQIENDVLISSRSERFDFIARKLIKIERYTAV